VAHPSRPIENSITNTTTIRHKTFITFAPNLTRETTIAFTRPALFTRSTRSRHRDGQRMLEAGDRRCRRQSKGARGRSYSATGRRRPLNSTQPTLQRLEIRRRFGGRHVIGYLPSCNPLSLTTVLGRKVHVHVFVSCL